MTEISRVLKYAHLLKYNVNVSYALKLVKALTVHFEITYPIKRLIAADENDDYLIALALQTSAGFLTSGDNDILREKETLERKYKKLKILTKIEFEAMFAN